MKNYHYLELHGKDVRQDVSRWRISAYYLPNFAETLFFYSQSEYDAYCSLHREKTDISVYTSWREKIEPAYN